VRVKPEMLGPAVVTVKDTPLLGVPNTVATTVPVVAPFGTRMTMLEALQLVAAPALRPLNVTVLEPWLEPKFAPEMVTEAPEGPDAGLMPLMLGAGTTLKVTPLLWTPLTVTSTGPVVAPAGTVTMILVALQFETVAIVLLKVTVLVPCVPPKLDPVMVTDRPAAPVVWLRLVIDGAGPPPPTPGLNEARIMPQLPEAPRVAEAEADPPDAWI